MERIAIIGAGAAGCFCAVEVARRHPSWQVSVFESGPVPLAKVALTGGGRCNFTNSFEGVSRLGEVYPRGEQLMKRALKAFSQQDVMDWFESEGVPYVIQDDNCVFPQSQDAMQIVHTFEGLMRRFGVEVRTRRKVSALRPADGVWTLEFEDGTSAAADRVVVTTGGGALSLLEGLDITIVPPVPSLFTLKIQDASLTSLMGAVVENASLGLAGTRFRSEGPLLLTDWGVSGPATLKLSSYAARHLAENQYRGTLLVNWLGGMNEAGARAWIAETVAGHAQKQLSSVHPDGLTARVWRHLLDRCGLRGEMRWAELGSKGVSRLANALTADSYPIAGRCRFKEEFVTAGGVALSEIDLNTLECRKHPGLYFAGEVLDVDAVTGGFNLQAAWSMAMAVARSLNL